MEEDEDGHFRRPPVTEDLRQILDKYPDGGQILKVCIVRVGELGDHYITPGDSPECGGRRGHGGQLRPGRAEISK